MKVDFFSQTYTISSGIGWYRLNEVILGSIYDSLFGSYNKTILISVILKLQRLLIPLLFIWFLVGIFRLIFLCVSLCIKACGDHIKWHPLSFLSTYIFFTIISRLSIISTIFYYTLFICFHLFKRTFLLF